VHRLETFELHVVLEDLVAELGHLRQTTFLEHLVRQWGLQYVIEAMLKGLPLYVVVDQWWVREHEWFVQCWHTFEQNAIVDLCEDTSVLDLNLLWELKWIFVFHQVKYLWKVLDALQVLFFRYWVVVLCEFLVEVEDLLAGLVTVEDRHVEVKEDNVVALALAVQFGSLDKFEGLLTVGSFVDLVDDCQLEQGPGEDAELEGIVVGDEESESPMGILAEEAPCLNKEVYVWLWTSLEA
jgi:hypothetical protein